MNLILKITKHEFWSLYIVFSFLMILLVFAGNYLLVDDNLIFNSYSEQLSFEQIKETIANTKKWEWLSYVLILVLYLIKFTLIGGCLKVGLFFIDKRISFTSILKATIIAEMVFLVPILIKIIWFLFINTNYSILDLQSFAPLSILNIFESKNLEPFLIYPFQLLNIFELLYFIVLAFQLKKFFENNFTESFQLVLSTYGSGLFVWVIFVVFLIVNNS